MNYDETVENLKKLYQMQLEECLDSDGHINHGISDSERKKYHFLLDLCCGWKMFNISWEMTGSMDLNNILEEYGNDAFYRTSFTPEVLAFVCSQRSGIDLDRLTKAISTAKSPDVILKDRLAKYKTRNKEYGKSNDIEIENTIKLYDKLTAEIKQKLQDMQAHRTRGGNGGRLHSYQSTAGDYGRVEKNSDERQ